MRLVSHGAATAAAAAQLTTKSRSRYFSLPRAFTQRFKGTLPPSGATDGSRSGGPARTPCVTGVRRLSNEPKRRRSEEFTVVRNSSGV